MSHRRLLVLNWLVVLCPALRNNWDVSWSLLFSSGPQKQCIFALQWQLLFFLDHGHMRLYILLKPCFQTPILPPTGCLSLKRSGNKIWWMSALPSRNPGSLQLPINTEFVSPVRSSAIYTLKRVQFQFPQHQRKKARSHGRYFGWECHSPVLHTVQSYTPKVSVARDLWNLSRYNLSVPPSCLIPTPPNLSCLQRSHCT